MGCPLCGGKIPMFASGAIGGQSVCDTCKDAFSRVSAATHKELANYITRRELEKDVEHLKHAFYSSDASVEAINKIRSAINRFDSLQNTTKEYIQKEKQLEKRIEESKDMLLTTTPILEGYKIVEYKGLVIGETIYKASAIDALAASIDTFARSLAFSSQELAEAVRLQQQAREFALDKMRVEAATRGANAIIGIDTDNTVGSSLAYLSFHGTAVVVEPL